MASKVVLEYKSASLNPSARLSFPIMRYDALHGSCHLYIHCCIGVLRYMTLVLISFLLTPLPQSKDNPCSFRLPCVTIHFIAERRTSKSMTVQINVLPHIASQVTGFTSDSTVRPASPSISLVDADASRFRRGAPGLPGLQVTG